MRNRYTLIDPDSAFGEIARILGGPLDKPQWVTKRYNIPAADMREPEVSTHINNVKNEGPDCLVPPTPRPVEIAPPPKTSKKINPNQLGLGF